MLTYHSSDECCYCLYLWFGLHIFSFFSFFFLSILITEHFWNVKHFLLLFFSSSSISRLLRFGFVSIKKNTAHKWDVQNMCTYQLFSLSRQMENFCLFLCYLLIFNSICANKGRKTTVKKKEKEKRNEDEKEVSWNGIEENRIGAIKTFLWIVQTCKKFVHYSISCSVFRAYRLVELVGGNESSNC